MARTVAIGIQQFNEIIENNCFYIDKTDFIREWWESRDSVTLITRPRRFGKTLNMSMVEQFFSARYAGRKDLFEGLSIWREEEYHALQGAFPVIFVSFAGVKSKTFQGVRDGVIKAIANAYEAHAYLKESGVLEKDESEYFEAFHKYAIDPSVNKQIADSVVGASLQTLSMYLERYYGKKVLILLDEYDTPLQEAYVDGYWDEMVGFIRELFNLTFKTNPWLERAIMTGITRVSKESIFSDLNNLEVVTTTSDKYADCFGFTEEEVFAAMEECGYTDKETVKRWYDGFTFGHIRDIYNPWSILNYLDKGEVTTYWANTSSNSLVGKLIREGSKSIKTSFEALLSGEHLKTAIDEQIVYNQLDENEQAIWSLLLASGYLKVVSFGSYENDEGTNDLKGGEYELALTNLEVKIMFQNMVLAWFGTVKSDYNEFVHALLMGDVDAMNEYMNRVAAETFSFFDTGRRASGRAEPERFYHGFVLGLMVDLRERYVLTSNRESGFGRYDIVLEPLSQADDGIIIEFKIYNSRREQNLEETLQNALKQIEDKKYEADLLARGIPAERIRKYGFVFEGKNVLIGGDGD